MATTLHNRNVFLLAVAAFIIRSYTFLIKDFMPYEFSRSVKEKYSNGASSRVTVLVGTFTGVKYIVNLTDTIKC